MPRGKTRYESIELKALRENLERALLTQIKMYGLPEGVPQYKIVPGRDWAWDRAWPNLKLACEVQGGTFMINSGHSSINGVIRDHEKHNAATLEGWVILYANTKTINDGSFVQLLAKYINKVVVC